MQQFCRWVNAKYGVGGITANINSNRYIQNCKVEKCILDTGCNSTSSSNIPVSGFVGTMMSGSKIYGYNIEVKDCDFLTHQWSNGAATNIKKAYTYTDENGVTHDPVSGMKCGNVVANGNSQTVNITAIHVENCPAADDFNSTASTSFIVYADYNDVASGNDKGTKMSTLSVLPSNYTNVSEGGLSDYFPNVNVSPVIHMGDDTILTGDGAALYSKSGVDTPVIDAIVNNYSIRTPATTSGGADKPTLRRSNTDEGNVTNIIMGSLYSQTVTINVKNNTTTASEITSANHRLDVELTSMITLAGTSSDKDYIIGHLANPNINLYQSFIIYLTAKDDDGILVTGLFTQTQKLILIC